MALGTRFGRSLFGEDLFAGTPVTETAELVQDLYHVEVYNNDFELQALLINWGSGQWKEKANEPSTLEFTYPYDDDKAQYLVWPNQIGLRDQFGVLKDRFRIANRTIIRNRAGARAYLVTCENLLAQLGDESVVNYAPGIVGLDVHLPALLNLQTHDLLVHVLLGDIDNDLGQITRRLILKNQSILHGIKELWKSAGGFFNVGVDGRFTWKRETTGNTGQTITSTKNMPILEVSEDWRGFATQVVALGRGATPTTRVSATANSTNQGTYGVIRRVVGMPTISTTEELQHLADNMVERTSNPEKKISCEALDLSQLNDSRFDYSHEALTIGSRIKIVDKSIDEYFETHIVSISRDLASPVHVTIEVANPDQEEVVSSTIRVSRRKRDVIDAIVDLILAKRELTTSETGLVDNQSLINDFSIDDWGDLWDALEDGLGLTATEIGEFLNPLVGVAGAGSTILQNVINDGGIATWQAYEGP